VGGLRDVITCAKFQIEIFMGYNFTGGRIFDFPIDFSMGLTTVQRYCAAWDVMTMNLDRLLYSISFIDLLECIVLRVLLVMCWPSRLLDLDDSNRLYTDDAVRLI